MKRYAILIGLLVLFLSGSAFALPAIIEVDEVKPGMKGYGYTVFEGYEPQRFEVEVKGVKYMWTGLVKTPVVVVKLSGGPEGYSMEEIGAAAGMSGSPIYFDTPEGPKVLGALAYGGAFDVTPNAGIQPARIMIEGAEALGDSPASLQKNGCLVKRHDCPLFLSGPFSTPKPSKELGDLFKQNGMRVIMSTACSGGAEYEETVSDKINLKPGSTINVYLVQGDIELGANGTVTMVDGDEFYAFGHPFFNNGLTSLPVTMPRMIMTVNNLAISYKYAEGGGKPIGVIEYDYNSGIKGRLGKRADMIPFSFNLTGGNAKREINCSIARVPGLTDRIITLIAYYTIEGGYGEFNMACKSPKGQGSAMITLKLEIEGVRPIKLAPFVCNYNEETFSSEFRKYISDLLINTLGPLSNAGLKLNSISFDIVYKTDYEILELTFAKFDKKWALPGDTLKLELTLKHTKGGMDGEIKFKTELPVFIPPTEIDTGEVKIEIKTGDYLDWPNPKNEYEVLAKALSLSNTRLFIKANFLKLESDNADSTISIGNVEWQVIVKGDRTGQTLILVGLVPLPVEEMFVDANKTLTIDIVDEEEVEERKAKADKKEKKKGKDRKWYFLWLF